MLIILTLLEFLCNFSVVSSSTEKKIISGQVFVSYSWEEKSEKIVNQLDQAFQKDEITLVRDKRDIDFKGKIQEFMEKLGQGKAVIVLKGDFYNRVFPILLENAQVFDPLHRIRYVEYWEKKIQALGAAMKKVSSANLHGFREDIDRYQEIRNTISNLTNTLRDMNSLTSERHKESGFQEMLQAIRKKLSEK